MKEIKNQLNSEKDWSKKAPILLIIFNRPETTLQVFEKIKQYKPEKLYIASDGARTNVPSEADIVKQVRNLVLDNINWECEIHTLFREENFGCGYNIAAAINWLFEQEEYGIILEDDCIPDVSFFYFCEELLVKYKYNESIFLISGTNNQNDIKRGIGSYYFSKYGGIWGWATWKRAWDTFKHDIDEDEMNANFSSDKFKNNFSTKTERRFWHKKFRNALKEKHSIWDFHWSYARLLNNSIGIVPNTNLIVNVGFNGTHKFLFDSIRHPSKLTPIDFPLVHPEIKVDRKADNYTYKNVYSHSLSRIVRLIRENGFINFINYLFHSIYN